MDLYGMSEALSQSNSFSQDQSAENEARRSGNANLDAAISGTRDTALEQKQGITSAEMSRDENSILSQAAGGLGLKSAVSTGGLANVEESLKAIPSVAKGGLARVGNLALDGTEKYVIGGLDKATDLASRAVGSVYKTFLNPIEQDIGEAVVRNTDKLSSGEAAAKTISDFRKGGGVVTAAKDLGDVSEVSDVLKGVKTEATVLGDSVKFLGGAGAVIGGGLALQTDISGGVKGFEKMNWEDKVGNILTLAGSTAELTGLVVPTPASLGLEAIGGVASLVGGVFSEIGAARDTTKAKATADTEQVTKAKGLSSQKSGAVATAGTGAYGGIGGAASDSTSKIQASGGF